MNFEDIKLKQMEKDKYQMIPLTWGIYSSQIQRQKVEWWLSEDGGVRKESYCLMAAVSVWGDDEEDGDDSCTTMNALNAT